MERTINKIPIVFEELFQENNIKSKYIMRQSDYTAHFIENEIALYLINDSFYEVSQTNDKKEIIESSNIFSNLYNKIKNIFKNEENKNVLKFTFNNCNENTKFVIEKQLPYNINYIKGNNKKDWIQNKPAYIKIKQENIYDGIDIVYYEKDNKLSYDFIVSKNANPKDISFSIQGSDNIIIDENGNINISKNASIITVKKPQTYQIINENIVDIKSQFILKNNNITFDIDKYNSNIELIIDPLVEHVNILGGNKEDSLNATAVDKDGNIYLTGKTLSIDHPLLNQKQFTINYDVFIMKLNKNGDIVYSARIGGSEDDESKGIAVDDDGYVYLTGKTMSPDFPKQNQIQDYLGQGDIFLTKIKIDINQNTGYEEGNILFSTYLGGIYEDYASSICLDKDKIVYITGYTNSSPQGEVNHDIFIYKIQIDDNDTSNTKILNYKLLGGENGTGNFIKVDENKNIYIVGEALSSTFKTVDKISDFKGKQDIYIIKLDENMNILFATYLNQGMYNSANSLYVDINENIYLTGYTMKDDYSKKHVCIYRIDNFGEITLAQNIAGNREEEGKTIYVDRYKNIYIGGCTTSSNFPTKNSCTRYEIGKYGFLTKLDSYGNIVFSTYTGKSDCETELNSIFVDNDINIYISGNTTSNTQHFTRAVNPDSQNVFIVKINQEPENLKKELKIADINLCAKIDKSLISQQDLSKLYFYINEANIVDFCVTETSKMERIKVSMIDCNNIPCLIEVRNININMGVDYKIGLVSGDKCLGNFKIYDLVGGYVLTNVDYGCLNINQNTPTKDNFKFKIIIDDMPITETNSWYVFNIKGKVYVEY